VVAVVDSGVKPKYHSLDGSVIGGEDFVGPCKAPSKEPNCFDPHGTFVAALISGNAKFPLDPTAAATFIASMNLNFSGALEYSGGTYYIDVIGAAPESQIYPVRVFGTEANATVSTLIAALESVITQRQNFDKHGQFSPGNPKGGFNIKVCNVSLGTTTT